MRCHVFVWEMETNIYIKLNGFCATKHFFALWSLNVSLHQTNNLMTLIAYTCRMHDKRRKTWIWGMNCVTYKDKNNIFSWVFHHRQLKAHTERAQTNSIGFMQYHFIETGRLALSVASYSHMIHYHCLTTSRIYEQTQKNP